MTKRPAAPPAAEPKQDQPIADCSEETVRKADAYYAEIKARKAAEPNEQVERLNVEQACATLRKHFSGHVWIASLLESIAAERDQLKGELALAAAMVGRAGYHNDKLNECKDERDRAVEALRGSMGKLEDGTLVRSIDRDASPNWHMRMLKLVMILKQADAVLAASLQPASPTLTEDR